MSFSKYTGEPSKKWLRDTRELIASHPILGRENLVDDILQIWDALWSTSIGSDEIGVTFRELNPRAQIVGEFFESLFARYLSQRGPWRRGNSKQKDVLCEEDSQEHFSFEIKTSGQKTGRIYGNRSYAQEDSQGKIESETRKKRSGYYLCLNFWGEQIYRIRAGWIDPDDWKPQSSPTGQMAGLKDYVYDYKLVDLQGEYYLGAPIFVVQGIGNKTTQALKTGGVTTVRDVLTLVPYKETPSETTYEAALKLELERQGVATRFAKLAARSFEDSSYLKKAHAIFASN